MNKDLTLSYYRQHSKFSTPGRYADEFQSLSPSIPTLCKIIQGLLIHETDGALYNIVHPPSRTSERRTRSVEDMLNAIYQLDDSPIAEHRPPKSRLIVSCRNFALLLVGMCRSLDIPARMRVGFSTYTSKDPDFYIEHSLVEYWHASIHKWIRVDPRVSSYHILQKRMTRQIDYLNVANQAFLTSGSVWLDVCRGCRNPDQYGFCGKQRYSGRWYIRNRLMHDLAALNKQEMLPWDIWGYMLHEAPGVDPTNKKQLRDISQLAQTIQSGEIYLHQIHQHWSNPNFQVPSIVLCNDRYAGVHSIFIERFDQNT